MLFILGKQIDAVKWDGLRGGAKCGTSPPTLQVASITRIIRYYVQLRLGFPDTTCSM